MKKMKNFLLFPATDEALRVARTSVMRNQFGRFDSYCKLTPQDYRIAENFNAAKELEELRKRRAEFLDSKK